MPEPKIIESIITRIQYEMGEPTVLPHHHLVDDLQIDSLDKINIIMGIEKQYCINITDEKIADFATVQDIANEVERLVKNG